MARSAKDISEKLTPVFSDPKIFEATVGSVKEFYAKFDKYKHFTARRAANKILKSKSKSLSNRQVDVAKQIAEKYRSVLLRQKKVVDDQICKDDSEIVDEKIHKSTKNMEIVDQQNVSYCYDIPHKCV